jgi:hypothetical protein
MQSELSFYYFELGAFRLIEEPKDGLGNCIGSFHRFVGHWQRMALFC